MNKIQQELCQSWAIKDQDMIKVEIKRLGEGG